MSTERKNSVITLCRVSTSEQAKEDRAGLGRQREAIRMAVKRYNLEVVKHYEIVDVSGTIVMQNQKFNEMLTMIQDDNIYGVVVADQDRLFRPDNFESFAILQRFIETDTKLITPNDILDLRTEQGFLMSGVQSLIAGNEIIKIKKRTWGAKEEKRKAGECPTSYHCIPFGVKYDKLTKIWSYDEDLAPLIKEAFNMVESGTSYHQIAKFLGHGKTIDGVRYLLSNPIYIGHRVCALLKQGEKVTSRTGKTYRKNIMRAPEDVIDVQVIEEPLISTEQFERVQALMKNKREDIIRKNKTAHYLLGGFLKCKECGEKLMVYTHSRKRKSGSRYHKYYYRCKTTDHRYKRKVTNKTCTCTESYDRATLDQTVISFISDKFSDVGTMVGILEEYINDNKQSDMSDRISAVNKRLTGELKKKKKLLELFYKDIYSVDELKAEVDSVNESIEVLQAKMTELERQSCLSNINMDNIRQIINCLCDFEYMTFEEQRTVLSLIVEWFWIDKDDGIVEVDFKLPLLEGSLDSSHTRSQRYPPVAFFLFNI